METVPGMSGPKEPRREARDIVREQIFMQMVAARLIDTFTEEMEDLYMAPEVLTEIHATFDNLTEENKRAVLSIPAELRPALFKRYKEQIEDGKMTGAGVVLDILEKARKHNFTLGYHLSQYDIKPGKDGSWVVQGTEKDHRNNDTPMAYYSRDYLHRYLKKRADYLYIVRAELKENSGHYQDNDGSWGRAPSLSVIEQIDMVALEKEIDERMKGWDSRRVEKNSEDKEGNG